MHLHGSIKRLYKLLFSLPLSLKILASTGIILSLGIASSDWFLYQKAEKMLMTSAWEGMQQSLKHQTERITEYLDDSRHDAVLLSHSPSIQKFLKDIESNQFPINHSSTEYAEISRLFSNLIQEKGYLQIRLIDLQSGMEIVRANRPKKSDLLPIIAKRSDLQNKKQSHYLKVGANLRRAQVFVSSINLNKEHGEITTPHQPTQRFVVGVFDDDLLHDKSPAFDLSKNIRSLDLKLTKSVRRAVQTGNLVWQEHYNYNATRLDLSLIKSRGYLKYDSEKEIDTIINTKKILTDIENKIFQLIAQGEIEDAERIITGNVYQQYKNSHIKNLNNLIIKLERINSNTKRTNKPNAIIVINTNFQDVLSAFRALKTHETILVNKEGQFLYHHEKSKQFSFEIYDDVQTLANEEQGVWGHLSLGIKEKMEFDTHGELHVSQRIFFDDIYHDQFMGLVLAKTKSDVLAPATKLGQHASIIAIVAISFSLFFILLIVKRQIRPITELTKHAVRISNTDLNESLPPSSNLDEVGKLTTAFSNLIIKLQDQHQTSKTQTNEINILNRDLENKINLRTASLKEATIRAESASTAKSEFLAIMSHEIRTPLNGILGVSKILSHTKLDNQQENYLNTIQESGKSLLIIINEILDFSKIESGKLQLEPINFNLEQTAQESIQLLTPRSSDKKIILSLDYSKEAPKYFLGDQGRLRQIILNLLGNSIKFTPEGHVKLNITSEYQQDGYYELRISVTDTGIGIPENDQHKIFGEFQQADASTTRKFGGTGLGLAICKKLVELMDGSIGLNSTEGKGSEFWFKVTLQNTTHHPENIASINHLSDKPEPPSLELKLQGKVLLVEDNQINQMVAQDMIERTGLTVDIADNGIKAIESWRNTHYDLIFMDCLMPEMDGYEATRQIRLLEKDTHIPIIALTANVLNSDKQACKDAGMDDFISKPIEVNLMNSTIEKWMKH